MGALGSSGSLSPLAENDGSRMIAEKRKSAEDP